MPPTTTTLTETVVTDTTSAFNYILAHPELLPTGLTITTILTAVILGWNKIRHILTNLENLPQGEDRTRYNERLTAIESNVDDIKTIVNRELRTNGGESMRDRMIRVETILAGETRPKTR